MDNMGFVIRPNLNPEITCSMDLNGSLTHLKKHDDDSTLGAIAEINKVMDVSKVSGGAL